MFSLLLVKEIYYYILCLSGRDINYTNVQLKGSGLSNVHQQR